MRGNGIRLLAAGILAIVAATAEGADGARVCRTDDGTAAVTAAASAQGLAVALERSPGGSAVVTATGPGLTVRKVVAADGSFSLSIATPDDAVSLRAAPGTIAVGRGNREAVVRLAPRGVSGAADAARLLAGSPAVRAFRAAVGAGGTSLRQSAAGTALYFADVALRVLQDDPAAVDRLRPTPAAAVQTVASPAPRPCYTEWETEVMAAWEWYEGCYGDFSWWSGGREACAFLYVLRVESAWFQLLTCVGFKS